MSGKDHINYSAGDIARYHRGEMSPPERHAIEKAALDDPFLADALEGYAYSTSPAQEIAALKAALDQRTGKQRTGVFFMSGSSRNTWLKMAAMFVLLAGIGLFIVRSSLNNKNGEVAIVPVKKTQTEQPAAAPEKTRDTGFSGLTKTVSSPTVSQPIHADTDQSSTQSSRNFDYRSNKVAKQPAVKVSPNDYMVALDANKKAEGEQATIQEDKFSITENKVDVVAAAPQNKAPVSQGYLNFKEIKGSVTNENGQPLPYASVSVNGTRLRTITDKEGNFTLPATDTAKLLTANAVGYEMAFVPVTKADKNVIVLKESPALSEVVVTGQAQGRKKAPSQFIVDSGDLEPEEGWIQYNEYVESKLKPIVAKTKERREVSLSFEVNDMGEPVNITVENSQCPQCNDQAIKLLREGPKWKKGKKGRISFRF